MFGKKESNPLERVITHDERGCYQYDPKSKGLSSEWHAKDVVHKVLLPGRQTVSEIST